MLRGTRSRLTYANVVATVALFIALGGASYAAVKLPKNSVSGTQIRKNAVTGAKVKDGSLTGADVKDKSLSAADLSGSVQGPAGPQGSAGPKGDTGAKGDAGAAGATKVVVRRKSSGALPANAFTSDNAFCQPGERATGGGGGFDGNGGNEIIQQSYPVLANGQRTEDGDTPVGWRVFIRNANAFALNNTLVWVVCARP